MAAYSSKAPICSKSMAACCFELEIEIVVALKLEIVAALNWKSVLPVVIDLPEIGGVASKSKLYILAVNNEVEGKEIIDRSPNPKNLLFSSACYSTLSLLNVKTLWLNLDLPVDKLLDLKSLAKHPLKYAHHLFDLMSRTQKPLFKIQLRRYTGENVVLRSLYLAVKNLINGYARNNKFQGCAAKLLTSINRYDMIIEKNDLEGVIGCKGTCEFLGSFFVYVAAESKMGVVRSIIYAALSFLLTIRFKRKKLNELHFEI
ncbi:hypothetical protein LXL04_022139 [Taraxacum kok-saghyz]